MSTSPLRPLVVDASAADPVPAPSEADASDLPLAPTAAAVIALARVQAAETAARPSIAHQGATKARGALLRAWLMQHGVGSLLGACSLLAMVLFWHLATTYRWDFYIRFTNLPTPMEVATQLGKAMDNTKFITHAGMSLRRIAIGFAVATVLGVGLGLLIGRYRLLRQLMFPAIEALRPIPAIAWVPISIMLWPDNEVSIVFITFIGAFFPILLNTVSGVQAVDAVLLRAGQCLGAREPQLMWHVVLPGAAPQVFTGLAVFLMGLALGLPPAQLAVLVLTVAAVLVLELINTATEAVVDLAIGRKFHPLARIAKDCAAAAVLVAAAASVLVALLLLVPPLLEKLGI